MAKQKTPQKTRIDWGLARAFFVGLDSTERTYPRVASEFGVSVPTVKKWAERQSWQELAAAEDAKAADKALAAAIRSREKRVQAVLMLLDRLIDHFIANVEAKATEASFSDLERMMKLAELLLGEATDRVSFTDAQAMQRRVMEIAGRWLAADVSPQERRAGMLREVMALGQGDDQGGSE